MRPRVLSEPASRPASAERPVTPTLKSFHISRRGKLLCHDSGGSSSTRSVVGRNQLRRRAASASLCELGEPRRRAVVSAEFSSACELGERRSEASTARSYRRNSHRRVSWVSGVEGVEPALRGSLSAPVRQPRRYRTPPTFNPLILPVQRRRRSTECWLSDHRVSENPRCWHSSFTLLTPGMTQTLHKVEISLSFFFISTQ